MLITEEYKAQNKVLHEKGTYGISGSKWTQAVLSLVDLADSKDILDYGCGRMTLAKSLPFNIRNYDPCIAGLDDKPESADIVTCTDVLEHIEPDCLDAVLKDLRRVTKMLGFFVIANRPAKKFLPDGRNAHLIQEGPEWWLPKIMRDFSLVQFNALAGEFVVIVR